MPQIRKLKAPASWLLATLLAALPLSMFTPGASAETLTQQRSLYAEASKAVGKKGGLARIQQLQPRLVNYPLYPYLEYEILSAQLTLAQKSRIERFLSRYADTPMAEKLRRRWLNYLRGNDDWKNFLLAHREDVGTDVDLACYYQSARYRNGAQKEALAAALELWQLPRPNPASCDGLFEILAFKGMITEEIAWQRYTKAILNGEFRLGDHLDGFLPTPRYKVMARSYAALAHNPQLLENAELFPVQTPETLLVVDQAICKIAKTDAPKAMAYWNRYRQLHGFAPSSQERVTSCLVKGLYDQSHRQVALKYLDDSAVVASAELLEWRLRLGLRERDWTGIAGWIERVPLNLRDEPMWRYWRARIGVMAGGKAPADGNTVVASFGELSMQRNFYGFLASDWTNAPYHMQRLPDALSKEQINRMAAKPVMVRIQELLHQRDRAAAATEWDFALKRFSLEEIRIAAHVAQRWQWYQQAIMAMSRANYLDDLEARFPRPYKAEFEKNARAVDVPPNLLFAIARQESAFNASIASPAGARGLMQLMPATAREVARKKRVPFYGVSDLDRPAVNVRLGSIYYRQMLDRFDDNRILATAAYNAGPGRVRSWLDDTDGKLPFDVWIETIPFKETRNYVQNVLAFSVIYNHHLGTRRRMLDAAEMQSPL
ncbi:MAG: transglycosylase SLT domain-containing protein [Porticoccaceae bacterium]